FFFFFSSRRRHTRFSRDWSSDVCSSDLETDLRPVNAPDDWSPWPLLVAGTPETDANRDGVPDSWMAANFPTNSSNELHESGYTRSEERRVGKRIELGGGSIMKMKNNRHS